MGDTCTQAGSTALIVLQGHLSGRQMLGTGFLPTYRIKAALDRWLKIPGYPIGLLTVCCKDSLSCGLITYPAHARIPQAL